MCCPAFFDFSTAPVGMVCEDKCGGRAHGQCADLCR